MAAPYEFDMGAKTKAFPLFCEKSEFTDDTVMTLAVAEGFMAAWLFDDLESVRRAARLSAEVTHNHPEGIKGAEATASAIWLARTGHSKDEIKAYLAQEFEYDLSRTCDETCLNYHHVESCQETVPEAVTAFLEGGSFEDVIRTAVSLGEDCDTLAAIAGSIAEGFYGVPGELKLSARKACRKS